MPMQHVLKAGSTADSLTSTCFTNRKTGHCFSSFVLCFYVLMCITFIVIPDDDCMGLKPVAQYSNCEGCFLIIVV
jgi:hypothetical protein